MCDRPVANAHGSQPPGDRGAIRGVAVTDEVARCHIPWECRSVRRSDGRVQTALRAGHPASGAATARLDRCDSKSNRRVDRPAGHRSSGKGTSAICWRITTPTTMGCARTLRSTRIRRSIDLRRQSGVSHQSLARRSPSALRSDGIVDPSKIALAPSNGLSRDRLKRVQD